MSLYEDVLKAISKLKYPETPEEVYKWLDDRNIKYYIDGDVIYILNTEKRVWAYE